MPILQTKTMFGFHKSLPESDALLRIVNARQRAEKARHALPCIFCPSTRQRALGNNLFGKQSFVVRWISWSTTKKSCSRRGTVRTRKQRYGVHNFVVRQQYDARQWSWQHCEGPVRVNRQEAPFVVHQPQQRTTMSQPFPCAGLQNARQWVSHLSDRFIS